MALVHIRGYFSSTDVDTFLFGHILEMVHVVLFYVYGSSLVDFHNSIFIRAFTTQTVTTYVIHIHPCNKFI